MEVKVYNFLSMLFQNKDFISQESQLLADEMSIVVVNLFRKNKESFNRTFKGGGEVLKAQFS